MALSADETHPTLVFDTDCVLCSRIVAFVLARERDRALRFVGAWSPEGEALAARHGFTKADLDATFLMIVDGVALTRSDAALAVLPHLAAPWRWLGGLKRIPRPVRDAAYGLVARHRYRLFGRRTNCMVVPPDEQGRFHGL